MVVKAIDTSLLKAFLVFSKLNFLRILAKLLSSVLKLGSIFLASFTFSALCLSAKALLTVNCLSSQEYCDIL